MFEVDSQSEGDAGLGERFVLHDLSAGARESRPRTTSAVAGFAADVREGLTAEAKHLPPKYFYDELGSLLFEAICLTPEYYVTRAEDEILREYADEIVRRAGIDDAKGDAEAGVPLALLELGSGNGEKTRRLVEAILRRQPTLRYLPVDISVSALERAADALLQSYPSLRITAYAADYEAALRHLAAHAPNEAEPSATRGRTLALFLGSNIGNFDRDEAARFLRDVRGVLRTGDALLVGADLRKDSRVLEAAYDDALGITAAFNLNLLARINRELAGDFRLDGFRHVAIYDEARGRIQMHLESVRAQAVRIGALNLTVEFKTGERIHTENSYKYDLKELDQLAAATGFARERTWFDQAHRFGSNLFRVVN